MARTRKEATSESGAYMSQYDQEVEVRLKALEEKSTTTPEFSKGGCSNCNCAELEKRIEALETALGHIKKTSIWNSKWD
jgi:hypothetical protein